MVSAESVCNVRSVSMKNQQAVVHSFQCVSTSDTCYSGCINLLHAEYVYIVPSAKCHCTGDILEVPASCPKNPSCSHIANYQNASVPIVKKNNHNTRNPKREVCFGGPLHGLYFNDWQLVGTLFFLASSLLITDIIVGNKYSHTM